MSLVTSLRSSAGEWATRASQFYASQSETIGRVTAVASPILMQVAPVSMPVGFVLTALHCITMIQTGSYEGYVLAALTAASLGMGILNPAIAPVIFLTQALVADLFAAKHNFSRGKTIQTLHDVANVVCTALRLTAKRIASVDLDIAVAAIYVSLSFYRLITEGKACYQGEDRYLELAGSLTMLALSGRNLSNQLEAKKLSLAPKDPSKKPFKAKIPRYLCPDLEPNAWGTAIQLVDRGVKCSLQALSRRLAPPPESRRWWQLTTS